MDTVPPQSVLIIVSAWAEPPGCDIRARITAVVNGEPGPKRGVAALGPDAVCQEVRRLLVEGFTT